jgi:hypothetical protein
MREAANWSKAMEQAVRTSANPRAARQVLAKSVAELERVLGVLRNSAGMALELRRADPGMREFTRGLYVKSSSAAKLAQGRLSQAFRLLAEASKRIADCAGDRAVATFERDRAVQFERESSRLASAAKRRTSLFPGH